MKNTELTHVTEHNQPQMVDVSMKKQTERSALAASTILVPLEVWNLLDSNEIQSKKGPVFSTAIIAGTMAAKKTSELIPFCHQIPLSNVRIEITTPRSGTIVITAEVKCLGQTGVEMEALTAATITALTVYDMLKAMGHDLNITSTKLLKKTGGKSDYVVGDLNYV